MTKDPTTWENRQAATAAIGLVARDPKKAPGDEVFAALMKRLADPSSQVRLAAIQSLTWIGGPVGLKRQAEMVHGLEKNTLLDSDLTVRVWTHMAIMSIEHKIQDKHLAPIAAILVNPKSDLAARVQACQSMATIGPDAANKKTIKALCDALKDADSTVIFWSMFCLARFGKAAPSAVPCLQAVVDDPNKPEAMRKLAQETIDIIHGKEKGKEKFKDKAVGK
jgi:HEAT repeat protein